MRWLALVLVLSLPALAELAPAGAAPKVEAALVVPEHPGGNQNAPSAPMGVIEGGWAYVYAAWGAGVFGLVAYAASLLLRRSEAVPPGGA